MSFFKRSIEFKSAGISCSGLLYEPNLNKGYKTAGVVMAHGMGAHKEMGLLPVAQKLACEGLAVLLFDYRFLGASEGSRCYQRGRIIPSEQIEDFQAALDYLATQPFIDAKRLGVWGTSFSGGHAIEVAACDSRVRALVCQTPALDLTQRITQLSEAAKAARLQAFELERQRIAAGLLPKTLAFASPDGKGAIMGLETDLWQKRMQAKFAPDFRNEFPYYCLEYITNYAPVRSLSKLFNKPILFIACTSDSISPLQTIRVAYDQAAQPKALVELPGGHYSVYEEPLQSQAAQAAADWFVQHL